MNIIYKYLVVFILLSTIGCSEIVNEEDLSDNQVEIISPTEGSHLENNVVLFSWQSMEGAEDYRLQIDVLNQYQYNERIIDTIVSNTSLSLQLLDDNNTYHWYITAQNSSSSTDNPVSHLFYVGQ